MKNCIKLCILLLAIIPFVKAQVADAENLGKPHEDEVKLQTLPASEAIESYFKRKEMKSAALVKDFGADRYLYRNDSVPMVRGLYYLDLKKGIDKRIYGGFIKEVVFGKDSKGRNLLIVHSISSRKGLINDEFLKVNLDFEGNFQAGTILSYSQSMVSGLCSEVEDRLSLAGNIDNYFIKEDENSFKVTFKVNEQDCKTGEKTDKKIEKVVKK